MFIISGANVFVISGVKFFENQIEKLVISGVKGFGNRCCQGVLKTVMPVCFNAWYRGAL